jgi:7-cyano-7-deazaguanine synthase in queuosine biosynthesis
VIKTRETIEDIKKRVRESQLNYSKNLRTVEEILLNERGYIFKKPLEEDVIFLCSGGLDSSIAIDIIIQEWNSKVHLVYFRRGARAQRFEEEAFDYFVNFYKKRYPNNIANPIKIECPVPLKEIKRYIPQEMVLTIGHPLRNSTMQNLAVQYAVALNNKLNLDIKTILIGAVGDDNTEPELGLLSLRTQTLNTCVQMGDWKWQISSPLIEPTLENRPIYKLDLIRYALEKNIPLEKTRTCFSSEEIADGTCFACQKRLRAFNYLGIKDPLPYKSN